jgi:hypothetical protein
MKNKILAILAVGLLAGPMVAQAVPMRLDATPLSQYTVGFYILFEDTGDNLLDFGEITSFSGLNEISSPLAGLVYIPSISGFTTAGGSTAGYAQCNTGWWCFIGPNYYSPRSPDDWEYSISRVDVPEPGTLALLGLGLAGLGFGKRRKTA